MDIEKQKLEQKNKQFKHSNASFFPFNVLGGMKKTSYIMIFVILFIAAAFMLLIHIDASAVEM